MRVALFVPCYVDLINPEVGVSVVRVLRRLGFSLACRGLDRYSGPSSMMVVTTKCGLLPKACALIQPYKKMGTPRKGASRPIEEEGR
jgi:hypothetical protein